MATVATDNAITLSFLAFMLNEFISQICVNILFIDNGAIHGAAVFEMRILSEHHAPLLDMLYFQTQTNVKICFKT